MKGKIGGVIIAPYVPFDKNGQLQEDVLGEHIDFLVNSGCHAFYSLGSTGEFPLMTASQRKKIAEKIVDQTKKRVKVVIHIGSESTNISIDLAMHAEEIGANAVYSVPPFYYKPDEIAILEHFKNIANCIKIPLHIYNIPRTTGVNITPDIMVKLSKISGITAMKDSAGDLDQTQQFIELTGMDVFMGKDALYLPSLMLGAAGCVSGVVGPVFPEIVMELYNAFKRNNFEKAVETQKRITAISKVLFGSRTSALIPTVKEAIKLRGHRMGSVLKPLRPLTKGERERLEKSLKNLKLI